MNTTIKLLNPFSVSLQKPPFMTVENKPVFVSGDYKIFKYSKEHYLHTFKNIIFSERVKPNKELIHNIITGDKPTEVARLYFDYERGKEAIQEGIEAAKLLNFKIQ